jgi:hypothetical protein
MADPEHNQFCVCTGVEWWLISARLHVDACRQIDD